MAAIKINARVGPQKTSNCGGAELKVDFDVGKKSGFIVQHIKFIDHFGPCGSELKDKVGPEYWECWEVAAGKVYCGFKPSGFPGGDTDTHDDFTLPDQGANTEGSQTIDGHVKFLEAATLTDPPWTPNSVSEAGILPATTEKPTGWDDAGAEPHSLSVTWRCCNGSSEPKVTGQPEKKKGGKDPRRMRPVERAIWDCTPWAAIRPDDTEGRRRLLAQLQPFKSFTLDEVRSAIKSYMRTAMTTGDRYDVGEMSRLYVLNRFIHCVPPTVPQEEARFYGGWGGVPQTRGQVRVLWPLAERRGQLRVAGHFGGYFGVPYDALGEFDHFRERFGPRWAPGSGQTS